MTLLTVLYGLAMWFYVALGAVVLAGNPRSRLNRSAALVLLCCAIWCIPGIAQSFHDAPLHSILTFADIGSIGWCSFASFFVLFAVDYTRWSGIRPAWLLYPPLSVMPLVFISAELSGGMYTTYALHWFGWATVWSDSVWPILYYLWYLGCMVFCIGLFAWYRRRTERRGERRLAGLMLYVTLITVLLGTIVNVAVPRLTRLEFPEIAPLIALLWAAALYHVARHRGLTLFAPQAAAGNILAALPDSLVLLSMDGRVLTANQAALDTFGYRRRELQGMPARLLFMQPAEFDQALSHVASGAAFKERHFRCRTSLGQELPVGLSARAMRDRDGETLGIIMMLRATGRESKPAEPPPTEV